MQLVVRKAVKEPLRRTVYKYGKVIGLDNLTCVFFT